MDGRACVLRAICEAADVTFKYNGLLGEVLHVLLRLVLSEYFSVKQLIDCFITLYSVIHHYK